MIKKVSDYFLQTYLRSLYYTSVYPCLINSEEVMGSFSQTQLNMFGRLVDRCFKILYKASLNDTAVDMEFLSFEHMYRYFCLIRIFKSYTMNSDPYFNYKSELCSTARYYNPRFFLNRILLPSNVIPSKESNHFV